MRDVNGGESERLAPVTPLFGARTRRTTPDTTTPPVAERRAPARDGRHRGEPSDDAWRTAASVDDEWYPTAEPAHTSDRAGEHGRAGAADEDEPTTPTVAEQWHPTWQRDPEPTRTREPTRLRALRPDDRDVSDASAARTGGPFFREMPDDAEPDDTDPKVRIEAAERVLLRKLRARQLSVAESRTVLAGLDVDPTEVEMLIETFADRGYLDDARLAEQLIHVGTDRKGQGRRAIAQTLSSRGIPRDVSDAVLAELPDDDADRALEFARTKARQLDRFDDATALRRLIGQLSRRGYPGSVAATAARTALDENRSQGGVRFR